VHITLILCFYFDIFYKNLCQFHTVVYTLISLQIITFIPSVHHVLVQLMLVVILPYLDHLFVVFSAITM